MQRSSQRNLSFRDIEFVITYGHEERTAGAIFYQLRDDCIPAMLPGNDPRRRLVGTTLVVCRCGQQMVTGYRNASAFKKDRRKARYDRRDRDYYCPCCEKMSA